MKKVLLAITGCVAIYKICELVRLLKKAGHDVRCLMTKSATELIQPNLFATLSENSAATDLFVNAAGNIEHIKFVKWSELIVVAPATANIIAKMANGIADDLVSTTLLASSNKPVIVVPAMNTDMWNNMAFQRNLKRIKRDGIIVIEPTSGELACGDYGKGRMEEPEILFNKLSKYL
jgi:phosphopantothenoylcysteine decarboxylase/phosphopantothenate--cysteine ligase